MKGHETGLGRYSEEKTRKIAVTDDWFSALTNISVIQMWKEAVAGPATGRTQYRVNRQG